MGSLESGSEGYDVYQAERNREKTRGQTEKTQETGFVDIDERIRSLTERISQMEKNRVAEGVGGKPLEKIGAEYAEYPEDLNEYKAEAAEGIEGSYRKREGALDKLNKLEASSDGSRTKELIEKMRGSLVADMDKLAGRYQEFTGKPLEVADRNANLESGNNEKVNVVPDGPEKPAPAVAEVKKDTSNEVQKIVEGSEKIFKSVGQLNSWASENRNSQNFMLKDFIQRNSRGFEEISSISNGLMGDSKRMAEAAPEDRKKIAKVMETRLKDLREIIDKGKRGVSAIKRSMQESGREVGGEQLERASKIFNLIDQSMSGAETAKPRVVEEENSKTSETPVQIKQPVAEPEASKTTSDNADEAPDAPVYADVDWNDSSQDQDLGDKELANSVQISDAISNNQSVAAEANNLQQPKVAEASPIVQEFAANHQQVQAEAISKYQNSEQQINQMRLQNQRNSDLLAGRKTVADRDISAGNQVLKEKGADDAFNTKLDAGNSQLDKAAFDKIIADVKAETAIPNEDKYILKDQKTSSETATVSQEMDDDLYVENENVKSGPRTEKAQSEEKSADNTTPEAANISDEKQKEVNQEDPLDGETDRMKRMELLREKIGGFDDSLKKNNDKIDALNKELRDSQAVVAEGDATQAGEWHMALQEKIDKEIDEIREDSAKITEERQTAANELGDLEARQAELEAKGRQMEGVILDANQEYEKIKDKSENLSEDQKALKVLMPALRVMEKNYAGKRDEFAKYLAIQAGSFLMKTQSSGLGEANESETAFARKIMTDARPFNNGRVDLFDQGLQKIQNKDYATDPDFEKNKDNIKPDVALATMLKYFSRKGQIKADEK
jgi:hypothetical protein